jgi:hypothetical protein
VATSNSAKTSLLELGLLLVGIPCAFLGFAVINGIFISLTHTGGNSDGGLGYTVAFFAALPLALLLLIERQLYVSYKKSRLATSSPTPPVDPSAPPPPGTWPPKEM